MQKRLLSTLRSSDYKSVLRSITATGFIFDCRSDEEFLQSMSRDGLSAWKDLSTANNNNCYSTGDMLLDGRYYNITVTVGNQGDYTVVAKLTEVQYT